MRWAVVRRDGLRVGGGAARLFFGPLRQLRFAMRDTRSSIIFSGSGASSPRRGCLNPAMCDPPYELSTKRDRRATYHRREMPVFSGEGVFVNFRHGGRG